MDTGARGQENEAQRLTRVAGAIREYVEAVQERAAAERTLNDALQAGALAQKDRDDALSTQLREAEDLEFDVLPMPTIDELPKPRWAISLPIW